MRDLEKWGPKVSSPFAFSPLAGNASQPCGLSHLPLNLSLCYLRLLSAGITGAHLHAPLQDPKVSYVTLRLLSK